MTIWIPIAAITVIVVSALLLPLFGRSGAAAPRRQRELAIYQDQLAELERERTAGRIAVAEAEAAATEIQRRMLASGSLSDRAEGAANPQAATRSRLLAVLAVGSLAPLGALLVYLSVGSPTVPGYPFDPARQAQAAAEAPAHGDAEIESMVATLAERMQQDPNNIEGWTLLARSYSALKRHSEAAMAYERVYALSKNDVAYAGDYGEALTLAAGGEVVPVAQKLFQQVAEHDPGEPRARYYLALALAQSGRPREAIAMWRGLEADSPPDAPWLSAVREVVQAVAKEAGIDASTVAPAGRALVTEPQQPGPTAEDMAAAQGMSPDDQRQMIEGMVARLAARLESEPNDIEGWLRLARSYAVLGQRDRAADALRRAAAVTDAPPALKSQVSSAAQELGIDPASNAAAAAPEAPPAAPDADGDQASMIQAMVDGLAQRLQSNPGDLEGWKRLGRSYLVLNQPARAQEAYSHAVALAPTDRDVLVGYANATMLAPGAVTVPKESVEMLRGALAADGKDTTALWLIAAAESDAGNKLQAAELLKRLLEQLPPDGAAYRTVQARLAQLAS